MRIILTGNKGFIGKHLETRLSNSGHQVVGIDLGSEYDLTKWETLKNITSFDLLIHLAASTFVPQSFSEPREFYQNNILGTLNALELCRQNDARLIYNSTYVYGVPQYLPVDEDHETEALNPYTHSKLIGEELCQKYADIFNVKSLIFRPFNVYGAFQNKRFLIPELIRQALNGHIEVQNPNPRRDFVFIDDLIDAYELALEHNFTGTNTFNIGSGKSYSVKEIVEMIMQTTGCRSVHYNQNIRKNEISDTVANVSKIESVLGWRPKYMMPEGLEITIKNFEQDG